MSDARILYIDDEVELLDLAASFFEDENLKLDTSSDYNEALELLKKNQYEVVISDAKLPTGSGPELFRYMKEKLNYQSKMVLVTGHLQDPGIEKEIDLVLYKPIEFQELVDQIKNLLV